ncbi:hypothetical protein CMI47_17135 [Candidatus Pacearchaeota archaeon]|nr:hypothetical protein [Candidatus Pacearchaeota archaeon]
MGSDPKYFNEFEYQEVPDSNYSIGGTDALANKGLVLSFWHVPSGENVYFKAFITTFNETYSSEWGGESVYGRADPIYLFKQTQRKITLAFKIPCSTEGEAYENLSKVQKLIQFLYPSYEDPASATTITQSPLIRLKVMNLLTNAANGASGQNAKEYYQSYRSSTDAEQGLLGAINNLTVNHNLENPDIGVLEKKDTQTEANAGVTVGAILPKLIEVNLDFSPIHESPLGWANSKTFSNTNFPYGAPNADVSKAAERQALLDQTEFAPPKPSPGIYTKSPTAAEDGFGSTDSKAQDSRLGGDEQEEEQGEISDQDLANAEARYAGAFGDIRRRRDDTRKEKGKDQSDYVKSAMAGKEAEEWDWTPWNDK